MAGERKWTRLTWAPAMLTIPFILLVLYALLLTSYETARHMVSEEGFIQKAEEVLLVAAALLCVYRLIRGPGTRKAWLYGTAITILILLRERDWHEAFTAEPVTKLSYYFHATDPLHVRIIAAAVLFIAGLVVLRWVKTYWSGFRRYLRERQPWAVNLLLYPVLQIIGQIVDKNTTSRSPGAIVEESFELYAVIVLCYLIIVFPLRRPTPDTSAQS
ncbi:MAG: hypothetical protein KJ626_04270 [Verrucomicrobia bacterium]|nr:hypothetical protein [Verrucomicrobiota bacterium]